MAEVIKVSDQNALVASNTFAHGHFPFDNFNPVQSRLVDFLETTSNVAIAAATSAGKTVCAEMYLSYELKVRGGKGMYISPLKALAQEKLDDWTNEPHQFAKRNISICTGDYKLTSARKSELEEADIIVMTSEMLSSRCRNYKSEKSNFLKEIGTIIIDESHLLTVPGRGDHLENAIMKITEINPNIRIVLLSATMPNVDEICRWISSLTNRDTYFLESEYRPCPLQIHYDTYWDGERKYEDNEAEKVTAALELVDAHPDDKFLIFVHTKRTGELMKKTLLLNNIECEFHNANLPLDKRIKLEKKFKEDKNFRVVVATSTLAWGCNLPARRVVILGIHRGLQEVENYDIQQMIGRAGRPAYDPRGDAHVLVPESKQKEYAYKLQKKTLIRSQMLEDASGQGHYKVLAFHLVSEIHSGNVKTVEDIHHWYRRTLAYFQAQELHEDIVDRVVELLLQCKAIQEQDGCYSCTAVGVIASMFYFSPFDVADLKSNFWKVFNSNKKDDDLWLSIALGNLDTHRFGIVNKAERAEMASYQGKIDRIFNKGTITDSAMKVGYAYHCILNGIDSMTFMALIQGLKVDSSRIIEVLMAIDGMAGKWGERDFIHTLQMRLMYGVRPELIELCRIPNIGKVRAEKLWSIKIRTMDDFLQHESKLAKILNISPAKIQESADAIRQIKLKDMMGG
jgi:helicase